MFSLDAVAEWVGLHHGRNFQTEPLDNRSQWIRRYLVSTLESRGTQTEALDDLVHDAASRIASGVNSDGIDAQVAFLVQDLGAEAALGAIGQAVVAEEA